MCGPCVHMQRAVVRGRRAYGRGVHMWRRAYDRGLPRLAKGRPGSHGEQHLPCAPVCESTLHSCERRPYARIFLPTYVDDSPLRTYVDDFPSDPISEMRRTYEKRTPCSRELRDSVGARARVSSPPPSLSLSSMPAAKSQKKAAKKAAEEARKKAAEEEAAEEEAAQEEAEEETAAAATEKQPGAAPAAGGSAAEAQEPVQPSSKAEKPKILKGQVAKLGKGTPPEPDEPACGLCNDGGKPQTDPDRNSTRIKKIKGSESWFAFGCKRIQDCKGKRICTSWQCNNSYEKMRDVRSRRAYAMACICDGVHMWWRAYACGVHMRWWHAYAVDSVCCLRSHASGVHMLTPPLS